MGYRWAKRGPWPKKKTPQSLERGVFIGGERVPLTSLGEQALKTICKLKAMRIPPNVPSDNEAFDYIEIIKA